MMKNRKTEKKDPLDSLEKWEKRKETRKADVVGENEVRCSSRMNEDSVKKLAQEESSV